MTMIPSAGPSITDREVELITEAARTGWYERMRWYTDEFERRFAEYAGTRYALSTNTCTAAIHLALLSLGIGAGDEVIVPDVTWVASAAPICYVGARPVFADIDPQSWCLSADAFERAITRRTKAVVAVGLYGNLPDMDAIRAIAKRRKVAIIEDAAESIGAEYRGRKAGTLGDIGVFSFNGTKLLVTGEGGMLVTDRRAVYERAKRLAHHGMDKRPGRKLFWSEELGWKYQMTNIQAAMGLAQLSRIDELVEQRRRLFGWYRERLRSVEGIQLNSEAPGVRSTFWVVTVILDRRYRLKKEAAMRALAEQGIATRPFFYPMSSMPAFAPFCKGKDMPRLNPVSYAVSPYGLSLPSAASVTEAQVDEVCERFIRLLRSRQRPAARTVAAAAG